MKKRKVEIQKINPPISSKLFDQKKSYDYVDSYQAIYLDHENNISATDIGKEFFTSGPKWSKKLFELRNHIVSIFGLKTPDKLSSREEKLKDFSCQKGEKLGLFHVYSSDENEVVLGENDKHLDFRISLLKGINNACEKTIIISTTVEFNNWFGRLYFLPVKQFHKSIVQKMLVGVVRTIENK